MVACQKRQGPPPLEPEAELPPAHPEPHGAPEDYPWTAPEKRSSLLLSTGIHELDAAADVPAIEKALLGDGGTPLAERTLVVAVGSNQSPAVIERKYRGAGHVGPVATPFLRCTLWGLDVGHSAHVSARGYIAAAPYVAPDAVTELVATWLDETQLAIVDRTEPNYERVELDGEEFPLQLASGLRPSRFAIYASRWGVIADGPPIAFRPQPQLFGLLAAQTGADAFTGKTAAVCARLAGDPEQIGQLLRERALVAGDGLPRP